MTTVRIAMTLLAANPDWRAEMQDAKGAFLHGQFQEHEEKIFIEVPQGLLHVYEHLGDEMKERLDRDDPMPD